MHQDIIMGMADEALAKILADLEADRRAKEERKKCKREEKLIECTNRTTKKRCTFGTGYNPEEFMKPISESVRNARLAGFIDRTSNGYIQQAVCMVCAGRFEKCIMYLCNVMDIPHQEKLVLQDPHPTAILTNNMLLHQRAIFHDGNSEQGPCWALANNMWIGDIPFELSILTIPERLLISLYYPAAYIYKLYPQKKGAKKDIEDLVRGNSLPRNPSILASILSVAIIGPQEAAILWLKNNNPLYQNVQLDEAALQEWPEVGIPSSISDTIHQDPSLSLLHQEGGGYIPESDEDEDEEPPGSVDIRDPYFESDDDDSDYEDSNATLTSSSSISASIPLNGTAVLDTTGCDIEDHSLMSSAMENTSGEDLSARHEPYKVHREAEFINDYARRDANGALTIGTPEDPITF
ncbi:hypothetical protein M422DRAFT_267032 [Sphaerobolus stellatus SS14]|uniref:DUF6570 domain-containing protein n=1 Tax=Sphaerobolus stellatus (strain SS14) TaxID=990650 RepID=A0A0C9U9Z6_SPHS4|nr:hypothetical protein M422DRAFT_267032 [Sphaerobolus stellatus SS14]